MAMTLGFTKETLDRIYRGTEKNSGSYTIDNNTVHVIVRELIALREVSQFDKDRLLEFSEQILKDRAEIAVVRERLGPAGYRIITDVVRLRKVLIELCEVKLIKDVQGDTPEYRARKIQAWEAAFACFEQYGSGRYSSSPSVRSEEE